jgi:hypothetical protein
MIGQAAPVLPKGDPYRMPEVEVGQIVHYYPGGITTRPCAAMVTQADGNSVVVNIFMPNSYNAAIRDGVRHVSDPRTKDSERIENGLWDFTPSELRLRQTIANLLDGRRKLPAQPALQPAITQS